METSIFSYSPCFWNLPGTILGVEDNRIFAFATVAKVICLEIASSLCEPELVDDIPVLVGGVEELDHRGVDVLCRLPCLVEWRAEVELPVRRPGLAQELGISISVGLSDGVVSAGLGILLAGIGVPS